MAAGPLAGMTVIAVKAIGPVLRCRLVLREFAGDVPRIEHETGSGWGIDLPASFDAFNRGKRGLALDLKQLATPRLPDGSPVSRTAQRFMSPAAG